jgi:hypothetical protein
MRFPEADRGSNINDTPSITVIRCFRPYEFGRLSARPRSREQAGYDPGRRLMELACSGMADRCTGGCPMRFLRRDCLSGLPIHNR